MRPNLNCWMPHVLCSVPGKTLAHHLEVWRCSWNVRLMFLACAKAFDNDQKVVAWIVKLVNNCVVLGST